MAKRRSAKRRTAVGGEWVLGRRSAPMEIAGEPPYRPDIVLLVEAASGFVIASDVVHPEASADEVAARVESSLKPGVSLRVDDEAIAEALRARLGPDQPVHVGPVPELRAPLAALTRFVGRGGRSRREQPLWTDDASAEARIGFFNAAAQFERSAPWEAAGDGQVLGLDVPAFGWEGACASILGAAGEEFGLLLFRSVEDYVLFTRLASEAERPATRRRGIGMLLLSVNFEQPANVTGGEVLAERARAHGWTPGPEGRLAYLLKVGPDSAVQPLTTEDYRLATAGLEAVRVFVGKNGRLFEAPPEERIETRSRIVMPTGEVEVRVTAPPDDLPWAWGEEEPIDGLRRIESASLLEGFLEARRASGAGEEEVDRIQSVVDEALRFKASRGEAGDRWTADEVEEYLLRHYPLRGGAPDEDVDLVPDGLDAFLEWLAAVGKGRAADLRAARGRIARCRDRFLTEASNPGGSAPADDRPRDGSRRGRPHGPPRRRGLPGGLQRQGGGGPLAHAPALGHPAARQGLGPIAPPAPARPAPCPAAAARATASAACPARPPWRDGRSRGRAPREPAGSRRPRVPRRTAVRTACTPKR